MSLEELLSRLDPKTASRIQSAQETEIERLPVASYGLTKALGGGIAKGRLTVCYGNESSGKSLLFQQSIAKWQKDGLVCAWVDAEGAYDKAWAGKLGIDNSNLALFHSKSSGRIENEVRPLIEGGLDVLVIDSISDILPETFVDSKSGEMNNQDDRKQLGAHAKAITALTNGLHYVNENTAIIYLSQTTTEITPTFTRQIPHGGKKVRFAASQIIRLSSSGTEGQQIKGKIPVGDLLLEQPIGRHIEAYVEKNKLGRQSGKAEYDIYYAGPLLGIDYVGEVVDEAVKYDIIEKNKAWMKYEGSSYAGRTGMVNFFKNDAEELSRLEKKIHTFETGEVVE